MKKFCEKCGVYIDRGFENCPLCGAHLTGEDVPQDDMPVAKRINYGYPNVNMQYLLKSFFKRLALFLSLLGVLGCVMVEILTDAKLEWSWHVIIAVGLFWFTLGRLLFFKVEARRQLILDCLAMIFLAFYVQYTTNTGNTNWALNWATPVIICAVIVTYFILMVIHYKEWGAYAMPLSFLCLFGWIPMVVAQCLYGMPFWTLVVQTLVCVLVLLGFLVFGNRRYVDEIRKRFHI